MHRRYMKEMKIVVRTVTGETSPYFLPIWAEVSANFPSIEEAQQDLANMFCQTNAVRLNRATALDCKTFEEVNTVNGHWINPSHIWQWEAAWSDSGKHIEVEVPEEIAAVLTRKPSSQDMMH